MDRYGFYCFAPMQSTNWWIAFCRFALRFVQRRKMIARASSNLFQIAETFTGTHRLTSEKNPHKRISKIGILNKCFRIRK